MATNDADKDYDAVIVGGGQAGLATAYHLRQRNCDFVVLDAGKQVGDAWRRRWDSLVLFTPAEYSNLPGMDFSAPPGHYPTKDEVADYLHTYASRFDLAVQLGTRVTRLTRQGGLYVAHADRGVYRARNAIVATGSFPTPYVPPFAGQLQPDILQLHSSEYRNPTQLHDGAVLVVGAGNSGVQIALDVAPGRQVWLSGHDLPHLPQRILGKDLFWWLCRTVFKLSTDSPFGQQLIKRMAEGGDFIVGIPNAHIQQAGIARVPRVAGVAEGKPELADGRILDVPSIIWATGFRYDYGWIDLSFFDERGLPRHERGVVLDSPGLYFVGLPFLHRANSSLVGGVGSDAEYVARRICDLAPRIH